MVACISKMGPGRVKTRASNLSVEFFSQSRVRASRSGQYCHSIAAGIAPGRKRKLSRSLTNAIFAFPPLPWNCRGGDPMEGGRKKATGAASMPGPFDRFAIRVAVRARRLRQWHLRERERAKPGWWLCPLFDAVIGPQQPRGGTSPGRPSIGHGAQIARGGPCVEREGQAGSLLQREVGGGEDIRVARREQEVDLGGPRADSLYAAKGWNGFRSTFAFEHGEIEPAGKRCLLDRPQGADFGRRISSGAQHVFSRRGELFGRDAAQRGFEPVVDRPARRNRDLLAGDDEHEPLEAAIEPADRDGAGLCGQRGENRMSLRELRDMPREVLVRLDEPRHDRTASNANRAASTSPICRSAQRSKAQIGSVSDRPSAVSR